MTDELPINLVVGDAPHYVADIRRKIDDARRGANDAELERLRQRLTRDDLDTLMTEITIAENHLQKFLDVFLARDEK
jgi:hypothetical protein